MSHDKKQLTLICFEGFTLPDDLYICNCADCGKLLTGTKSAHRIGYLVGLRKMTLPPQVSNYMGGRPFCSDCMTLNRPPRNGCRAPGIPTGPNPWHENAMRDLEETRSEF